MSPVAPVIPAAELRPVGRTVLLVIDIQGTGSAADTEPGLAFMATRSERIAGSLALVHAFREKSLPVIFVQEVHKPSLIDIGRELDGAEGPHALENDPATALYPGFEPLPEEYLVRKRRYSAFFGSDLDLILRGYGAETIVMVGAMSDVCVHYTAVDAHQLDYRFRTVGDLVFGSSDEAHEAALHAMKYLQRDGVVSAEAVHRWLAEFASEQPRLTPNH
jgi:nicotinamidase-related amidase